MTSSVTRRSPFVGREPELAALVERLAAAGQPAAPPVLLLAGEPGIGKTRLLSELAERARAAGWRVLSGRAYQSEGMPPYLPFTEALAEYVRTAPPERLGAQLTGAAGAALALLLPDLRDRIGDLLPAGPSLGPEQERYRLFEAVTELLLAIARDLPPDPLPKGRGSHGSAAVPKDEAPLPFRGGAGGEVVSVTTSGLLLVLDDLHWADRPSLLLLQHLARRVPRGGESTGIPPYPRGGDSKGTPPYTEAPLLIVGSYRTVDVDRAHPLADVLADLRREELIERLTLSPFSQAAAGALVEALTGRAPAPAVVEALHAETEGNPFFLTEVVRHLVAEGHDPADPRTPVARAGIPEDVREMIGRRLARISPEANRALQAGAVLGDGFGFELLTAVSEIGSGPLLDALDEALGAGMLHEDGGGYRFDHALVRQTVYDDLRLARRQHLHLRAAQAIETVHARNLTPHLAALAAHFRAARTAAAVDKAIDYAMRAGEAARAVFAWDEAAAQWQAALDLMAEHPDLSGPSRRCALLERLADLLRTSFDDQPRHIACLEEATGLYDAAGDAVAAARARIAAAAALTSLGPTQDLGRAESLLRKAEPVLARGPADATVGYFFHAVARVAGFRLRTDEGLAASLRALEIAEALGDERLQATVAPTLASHLLASGRVSEAFTALERGWALADRLDDAGLTFTITALAAASARLLHDFRVAGDWCERELRSPRHAGASGGREVLLAYLARAQGERGQVATGRQLAAQIAPRPRTFLAAHFLEVALATWAGDWPRLLRLTEEARDGFRRAGDRLLLAEHSLDAALALRALGEDARAEAVLQEALAIGLDGPHAPVELATRAELALLYADTGRAAAAAPHLDRCRQIVAGGEDWRGLAGRVALAEASVAASMRRSEAAADSFDAAVELFRRLEAPWDEAEARAAWSRLPSAAGQLAAAVDIYRTIGAGEPWQALTRSAEVGTRNQTDSRSAFRVPRSAFPDGLSEREVEVLRLLAAGRSNPEIAAALVISLNTVYRHVNHIFIKIGVSNRVEAASYAHRQGLAE